MITANELRIGNCIRFHNHVEAEKIVTVNARFFSSLAGGRSLEEMKPDEELSNYYSPIELTPEILVKCGFKINKYACYLHFCKSAYIHYSIKNKVLGMAISNHNESLDTDEELSIDLNIIYLHQLQNLCYSLTGSELEVVW